VAWNRAYELNPDLEDVARYLQRVIKNSFLSELRVLILTLEKENVLQVRVQFISRFQAPGLPANLLPCTIQRPIG